MKKKLILIPIMLILIALPVLSTIYNTGGVPNDFTNPTYAFDDSGSTKASVTNEVLVGASSHYLGETYTNKVQIRNINITLQSLVDDAGSNYNRAYLQLYNGSDWTTHTTLYEDADITNTYTGTITIGQDVNGYRVYFLLYDGSAGSANTQSAEVTTLSPGLYYPDYALFNLKDKETSGALENGTITIKKMVSGSLVNLSVLYTDISGTIRFNYDPETEYYFYCTYTGYQGRNFSLNPILFDSYNIGLTSLLTYDIEQVSMLSNIQTYRNGYSNNLSITYYNPAVDSFTLYGFNISYPGSGGWLERNGTTPLGSVLNREVNITGATLYDKVYLNMYYQRVGETERTNLNYAYYILISPGNYTWVNNRLDNNGIGATLGIFEKILITTLLVIMAGGLAMMVAGPIAGGVVGLVVMGFLAYMGLAPVSAIIVSLIVGFIVISWRSSQ